MPAYAIAPLVVEFYNADINRDSSGVIVKNNFRRLPPEYQRSPPRSRKCPLTFCDGTLRKVGGAIKHKPADLGGDEIRSLFQCSLCGGQFHDGVTEDFPEVITHEWRSKNERS